MKSLITVEERINKDEKGGIISYSYHAPTHWNGDGIIRLRKRDSGFSLSYGSGGTNAGFSDIIIADAMAQAFAMAKQRLIKLES